MSNFRPWGIGPRSASLSHAIPMSTMADPIGWLEVDGTRYALARRSDEERCAEAGFEAVSLFDLGWEQLQAEPVPFEQAMAELVLRACQHLDVDDVRVADDFPLSLVEHLRANG